MTCEIPSYVAEFVFVDLWTDSDGGSYYPGNEQEIGTIQNTFIPKKNPCLHFLFCFDFTKLDSPIDSIRKNTINESYHFSVVQQFYQTRVIDEFVLRGNAATLKCNLPSFISDFVSVESWISDDGTEILPNANDFGL